MTDSVRLPFMPLWTSDLDADRSCRAMSDAEFGRYMRLLVRQWIEGGVPPDATSAIRDAMLDPGSDESVTKLLREKFPEREGGVRLNPRCASERQKAVEKVLRMRELGRAGGKAKGQAYALANGKADARANALAGASVSVSDSGSSSSGKGDRGKGSQAQGLWVAVSNTLPESMRTDAMLHAWGEWEAHRRERKPRITPTSAVKQAKKLAEMNDVTRAIAAIEHSIAGGYQNIFEPNGSGNGRAHKLTQADRLAERSKQRAEREYTEPEPELKA